MAERRMTLRSAISQEIREAEKVRKMKMVMFVFLAGKLQLLLFLEKTRKGERGF